MEDPWISRNTQLMKSNDVYRIWQIDRCGMNMNWKYEEEKTDSAELYMKTYWDSVMESERKKYKVRGCKRECTGNDLQEIQYNEVKRKKRMYRQEDLKRRGPGRWWKKIWSEDRKLEVWNQFTSQFVVFRGRVIQGWDPCISTSGGLCDDLMTGDKLARKWQVST